MPSTASGRRTKDRHWSRPRQLPWTAGDAPADRPAAPVAPGALRRAAGPPAYLLVRCGEASEAVLPADDLVERFGIPRQALQEHLSLLNPVNFGGGCYAAYAELRDDEVHVDKELFGDTFRSPPRLTPLEARAIRLALEFVGPMIAADAHTPLERVRRKLEETFGAFELTQTPTPGGGSDEERLIATLSEAIRNRRLVSIEYLKEEETPSTRVGSRTSWSAGCRTGTSTPGTARARASGASDSTACAAPSPTRRSSRGAGLRAARAAGRQAGARLVLAGGGEVACGARRMKARSRTARLWPRRPSPSGWSARSSSTAARRSCSSRRTSGSASLRVQPCWPVSSAASMSTSRPSPPPARPGGRAPSVRARRACRRRPRRSARAAAGASKPAVLPRATRAFRRR